MKPVTFLPIGLIYTQYTDNEGVPIQSALAEKSMMAVAEIAPHFIAGLEGLEAFTHAILVYHFHKSGAPQLKQKPFLDDDLHGIFSIRSPHRPNPIGISIVELVKIEENKIYFNHADILDGTPLLDIKPFIPAFDHREDANNGWLEAKFPFDPIAE
jgi:tRNA-Thr(GGU) m(6)t(6)A37 methyltransferase TsaA